jgi:ubiquinone/menaquinone biosynthesis C-methylase UbiE
MENWWPLDVETDNFLHPSSRIGFSRSGELYDKSRSNYPDVVASRLFKHLNVKPGDKVLDLAAGTGKWTERLVRHGCEVYAAEPSKAMREKFSERMPSVPVTDALAEALPWGESTFDSVFAATAFHWFDAEAAAREIHRVLKPGGSLGLLWTAWDSESIPEWYRAVRSRIQPFESGTPRYRHMIWRKPFDEMRLFDFLQFESHDNTRAVTSTEIVERMLSISYVAALPDLVFNALKAQLEDILRAYILRGQIFKMPEEIHIYWTRKKS